MIKITRDGTSWWVEVGEGRTLLELAQAGDVPLRYACQNADCGTCVVRVEGEGLEPPNRLERDCLGRIGAFPDERLACQARVRAGASLRVSLETT